LLEPCAGKLASTVLRGGRRSNAAALPDADHGRLKARLRPMRGIKTDRSLRIVAAGHAFIQNLRCGHYELATDATARDRVAVAFTELALAI
jgi:transposase, IS6 family